MPNLVRCGILWAMKTLAGTRDDWNAELRRPLPDVPREPLFEGAPEGQEFRAREAARYLAALAAIAVSAHLPVRGGARQPARITASVALCAGAVGLLSHRRWPEVVTLGGCALAAGTMLVRPVSYDPLASVALAIAALALTDLRRIPRRNETRTR